MPKGPNTAQFIPWFNTSNLHDVIYWSFINGTWRFYCRLTDSKSCQEEKRWCSRVACGTIFCVQQASCAYCLSTCLQVLLPPNFLSTFVAKLCALPPLLIKSARTEADQRYTFSARTSSSLQLRRVTPFPSLPPPGDS